MDRLVYLSMSGAKATMHRQEVLSHNLANVSTNGFRAEMAALRAVPVRGDGASTRVYTLETTIGYDEAPGVVQATGRSLDVAMSGRAWMAIQALDGTEAYTRAGALQTNAEGTLVDIQGRPVLGDGGPITVPANARIDIANDGTLNATVGNGRPQNIGRIKLVTPEAKLERGLDGLFRPQGGDPLPADANARLKAGALEGSNVNAVETMVAMISAARQFEHQMKMMQNAERKEEQAAKLLGTV